MAVGIADLIDVQHEGDRVPFGDLHLGVDVPVVGDQLDAGDQGELGRVGGQDDALPVAPGSPRGVRSWSSTTPSVVMKRVIRTLVSGK